MLISLHSTARNIRKWTSSGEVRLELLLRADRAHVLANGANPKGYTDREFQRRWIKLEK